MIGYSFPKNTFLQFNHYIQKIYLTLLATTCVKIHQMTYVIFEIISHFSRHNSLAQTLHTFYKNCQPIKAQFFRFFTALIKVHQILHVIFQKESVFFQSLDLFSMPWQMTLLYFFNCNFICNWQKQHYIKVQIFRVATTRIKFTKFLMPFLEPIASYSSNFSSLFSVSTFSSKSLYALDKRSLSKGKFPDFQLLTWKLTKFLILLTRHEWVFL